MRNFEWSGAFQILAFCLGWGAALDSPHPVGAFFGTWFFAAAVFWYLGVLISHGSRSGKPSGEGPGSENSSGGDG